MTGSTCTKRELYYKKPELFVDQITSDIALNDVSCLLDCPLWELGVFSSSKGLVAGDLTIKYNNSNIVYSKEKGSNVPSDLINIESVSSNAKLALIVEKDTVFQRLIDDKIFDKFNLILLTVSF